MWGAVDEVGEGDQSRGETDGRAVEGCDEDFGVRIECICDVEIVGDEGAEPFAAGIGAWRGRAGDCDVGAAVGGRVVNFLGTLLRRVEGRGEVVGEHTRRSNGLCLSGW